MPAKGQSVLKKAKTPAKAKAKATAADLTPKAKTKKPRKPKSARTGATHKELNTRFRELGRKLAKLTSGKKFVFDVPAVKEHKANVFTRMLEKAEEQGALKPKYFNDSYRAAWANMDELVSTSSVREIVLGILDENKTNPFTKSQTEEINAILDAVSRVRLPTEMVGYSLSKTEVMQHPTSPGAGYYAAAQTASLHATHDNQRKNEVDVAVQAELKNPKATAVSIMKAAVKAAIAYTLNEMAAPITASDVKPFSRKASEDDSKLTASIEKRETMKSIFVGVGGTQDADDPRDPNLPPETLAERRGRKWATRRGKRSVSPPRNVLKPSTTSTTSLSDAPQYVPNAPQGTAPPNVAPLADLVELLL